MNPAFCAYSLTGNSWVMKTDRYLLRLVYVKMEPTVYSDVEEIKRLSGILTHPFNSRSFNGGFQLFENRDEISTSL